MPGGGRGSAYYALFILILIFNSYPLFLTLLRGEARGTDDTAVTGTWSRGGGGLMTNGLCDCVWCDGSLV